MAQHGLVVLCFTRVFSRTGVFWFVMAEPFTSIGGGAVIVGILFKWQGLYNSNKLMLSVEGQANG